MSGPQNPKDPLVKQAGEDITSPDTPANGEGSSAEGLTTEALGGGNTADSGPKNPRDPDSSKQKV
jgi:hypothetical protein